MTFFHKRPVLTVVFAGLLLIVAGIALWRRSLSSANNERLRAIAARGEPTSLAELDQFYKSVPATNNAALLWLQGYATLTNNFGDIAGKFTVKRGVPLNGERLREATEALAANAEAMALFHRAAELSESRYPITLNQQLFTNLYHLAQIKGVAQILRVEAAVAVAQANSALAAEGIAGMFAAGRSMAVEPLMISQLVAYAIDAVSVQTLQFALNAATFTEPELLAMQTGVSKADDLENAARGLLGERAFFVSALSDPAGYVAAARGAPPSGTEEILSDVFLMPLASVTGFWQRDLRFGIDALTTSIALARLPDPERFQSRNDSAEIMKEAQRGRYILTAMLLPALEKFVTRDANHRAQLRTAQVSVAIERYRLVHEGSLPDDLSSLVPKYIAKLPIDPFDGQPVRYKRTDRGYVVWCIGVDEKDDGGAERVPNAPKGSPEDVTFIVERQ
jgi:hypothetical protein